MQSKSELFGIPKRSAPYSMLSVAADQGVSGVTYGSTGTAVLRFFDRVIVNQGYDLDYNDDSVYGTSITIRTPGVYSITAFTFHNGAHEYNLGVTKNIAIANLATGPTALIYNNQDPGVLSLSGLLTGADGGGPSVTWTGYCDAGDVIRIMSDLTGTTVNLGVFTVSKVG